MNFDNDSTSLNSLSLNSFRKFEASCRALQTVRLVSEKKSLLSEIGEFLNDSKILRILDSLTCGELEIEYDKENVPQYSQYSNEPLSLDWNTLFNLIQNFVINELKTIKDKNISFSQSNRTASSQNIDNKIYQLRAVLNLVLNQINSRTRHYLKLSNFLNLFDYLVDMSNDFSIFQAKILNDLSNFLHNQILISQIYCCQINKSNWIEFINFYMNNYLNYLSSNISIDHMCSIKCLRKILSIVFQYAGLINTTKIFSFLSTALTEIRKDSNPELIDNVIGCVYELSNNFHHDFLFEVLKFGEEIGLKLIEICEFLNTGVNSKEIVLKFLILQINLRKNTEKTDFKINSLWTEILKSAYEWSKEETYTNIRQQLASISLKSNKTNTHKFLENEECLFLVVSECWFILSRLPCINRYAVINSSGVENSPIKKRKIDNDIYSWSNVLSQIDHDLDIVAKIYWNKFFEKIFYLYHTELFNDKIDSRILNFLNKNLYLIDTKINVLNEDRIRSNIVINSTLSFLTVLLKYYTIDADVNFDFQKILNYSFINRSHKNLILEILKFKPKLVKNLTQILVSKKDNLDSFSLGLFSKANLYDLSVKLKFQVINCILSFDSDFYIDPNFTNYSLISEIILRILSLREKRNCESLDFKFLFHPNHENFCQTEIDDEECNYSMQNIVPNLDVLKHVVQLLSYRMQLIDAKKMSESSLSLVLIVLNILAQYETFDLENLEKLKFESRIFFSELLNYFDILENLDLSVKCFEEIFQTFKNLNSKKIFLHTLGPAMVEFSLKILDISIESEPYGKSLFYLRDISKLEYLKLLSMSLLCNLSIQESNQKIGTNLKKRLFYFLNNLTTDKKETFIILFLICFKSCKCLDFKEFSICLDWFDYVINKFKNLSIQIRILVLKLYRKYFGKILASSCLNLDDDSQLDQSQSKYIKIMDTYFLDSGNLIEINLIICEIFGDILKLMRVRNFTKKDILGFFTKFYNQFLNNANQSFKVQQHAIKIISQACFHNVKVICCNFTRDYNLNQDSFIKYLEKLDCVYSNFNYDLENSFFDRIYLNLVLENKIFETECSGTFESRPSIERNMLTDQRYSIYKKFFISIKRQLTEPLLMKRLVLDYFDQLFELTKDYDRKFLVKSMFGLIQIFCEYKCHFEPGKIKNLLSKTSNFENLKSDLVRQWIEIYITEEDDLKSLNNLIESKFPLVLFSYQEKSDFFSKHLDQIIAFSLEKFGTKPENILCNLDVNQVEKLRPNIYATMIREALFKGSLELKILFNSIFWDSDFIKNNFSEIFEQVFFTAKLADVTEDKLQKNVHYLMEIFVNEEKKSSSLYRLLGNSPYSIYKILINIRNLIKKSNLNYSFNLFLVFINSVILPMNETSFDLISNASDCIYLLNENILFSLVNFLQLFNSKFADLEQNKKDFLNNLYVLIKFSKKFIVKLFNIFTSVVEYLENSIEHHDYAISCVIWHFFDYLNKYPQFGLNVDYMEDLNKNIFLNLVNFLQKYHKFSPRLKRQLKFLYHQRNFLLNNFDDQLLKDTLMLNLKLYGDLNKKYESTLNYELGSEIDEVLTSVDFCAKLSFKFLLCYAINLVIIELKNESKNMQINKIVVKIVEKLKNLDYQSDEIRKLGGILISKVGPVFTLRENEPFENNEVDKQNYFMTSRFLNESTKPMHSFYFDLYLHLNDLLTDNDIERQLFGNEMIEVFFSMKDSNAFLIECKSFVSQYLKIENEKKEFTELSNENKCKLNDRFIEYTKLFNYNKVKIVDKSNKNLTKNSAIFQKIDWNFEKISYEEWIRNVAENLIQVNIVEDSVSQNFRKVFDLKTKMCELFILYNIKITIEKSSEISSLIAQKISTFFKSYQENLKNEFLSIERTKVIKFYLKLIDFIRINSIKCKNNAVFWLDNIDFWKHIDFLTLAQIALRVSENFAAIYYVEVWYNRIIFSQKRGFKNSNFEIFKSNLRSIEILFKCFKNVGEKNALETELIYLVHSSQNCLNASYYESNDEQLTYFDNYLSVSADGNDISSAKAGLVKSLKNKGLNFLKSCVLNNHDEESDLADSKYLHSSRLGFWEDIDFKTESIIESNFYESLNNLFCIENQGNKFIIDMGITNTIKYADYLICDLKFENLFEHKTNIGSIIKLYNLEEIKKCLVVLRNKKENEYLELVSNNLSRFENYETKYFMGNSDSFELFDNLLKLRLKSSQILFDKNDQLTKIDEYEENLFEKLIDNSIYFKKFEIGQFYVNQMRKSLFSIKLKCDIKEAQLEFSKSNLKKAKFILRNSIEKFEYSKLKMTDTLNQSDIKNYIIALDLYGHLLNQTKSENPNYIIKKILEKSVHYISQFNLKERPENIRLIVDSFFSLAKFADSHYQSISDYVNSKSFEEHAELVKKFQVESNKTKIIDPSSHFNLILNKQYNIDREEMDNLIENKEIYLCKSINYYLYCLELGSDHQQDNYCVFRLVSLWTQNSLNLKVNKTIEEKIFKISSHKFIILIYQLAARMSLEALESDHDSSQKLFQSILIALVTKTSQEHPHHCLPVLFAFSNSHRDFLLTKSNDEVGNYLKAEDRVNTSTSILAKLKNSDYMIRIIESMDQVCHSYIELANSNITTRPKATESLVFPKNLLINKIRNYKFTNVLTNTIKINPNGCYDESKLIYIVKFDPIFKVANGVNMPKIVQCLGSDGILRKQLVKGKDDLRQDAVMQQFFSTVNDLIKANNVSRNTIELNTMKTYKIVPLSQKSGVLEWCQNTITIGDWLIGQNQDGGAHKKYEPNDLKFDECKRILYEASQPNGLRKLKKKSKLEVFLDVTDKFKPVFRHFFMENFHQQKEWFKKRQNFTKSVATSSMVGYIVGLGDRHVQNILIDTSTADVVHIDLGIAFDQGKILPIPETVPFRLTRDIIDGFGICAVEGIFKNCCESTLELLKSSREQIMTIFEVLLYDPLHNWCLSPAKAFMMQQAMDFNNQPQADNETSLFHPASFDSSNKINSTQKTNKSTEKNKIAERILFQIKQKLLGYENGTQLSTDGQINFLINEATNPENLCRIYVGWQPYL